MSDQVRVRFAPSPTGYLHVGGVRTALFNWLWAKKNNSAFVLRIEDTDLERSTPESKAIILESLKWLGIDWQEGPEVGGKYGPYQQTERLDLYKHYADKLIAEGKAYKCYCTEEDLKEARTAMTAKRDAGDKGAFFKYPGTCRDRKDAPKDAQYVVRFKAPTEGAVEYTDLVFGRMVVPNKENQDFVLLRSDGVPLYNFGAVIDDFTMGITTVGRGRDHMINTPPQILLYQALGVQHPHFAHLPMMLSATGEKLSKRHNAVSTTEYRDAGYAPGAVLNYLAKFGWGYKNQEIFSVKELIETFSWEGCGKGDGRFDVKKFEAINYAHLKSIDLVPDDEYTSHVLPHLAKRGLTDLDPARVRALVSVVRSRAKTFVESADMLDPFLRKNIVIDADAVVSEDAKAITKSYTDFLSTIDAWNVDTLKERTTNWIIENNTSMKDIGQAVRIAVFGRTKSPELFATLAALGKDTTIERLKCQASS